MPESEPFHSGRKLAGGRFTLVRSLGGGGAAASWLADDEQLGKTVALKFVPAALLNNSTALEQLRNRAARIRHMAHPGIVRVHEFHESPEEPTFIAMDFVDGYSLDKMRARQPHGILSWEYLRGILPQICGVLHYAHGEGMVHGRLKLEEIIIDNQGRARLIGFVPGATDAPGPWLSPQRLRGEAPRPTDDIYALGAALYELLTGEPPFPKGATSKGNQPQPPRERLAARGIDNIISPDLSAMILSCLAPEPDERPQSAQAVARWMEDAAEENSFASAPHPPRAVAKPDRAKVLWRVGLLILLLLLTELLFWKMGQRAKQPENHGGNVPGAQAR